MRQALPKHQSGVATLIMVTVLLFVLSMMSVFAARVVITDHKISRNNYDAARVAAAASIGLEKAMLSLDKATVEGSNNTTNYSVFVSEVDADCPFIVGGEDPGLKCIKDENNVALGVISAIYRKDTANLPAGTVLLTLTTRLPNGESGRTSQQLVRFAKTFNSESPAPLVVGDNVSANNTTVQNKTDGSYKDVAVWAGGTITATPSKNLTTAGVDGMYSGDANLQNLNTDEMFENFFGFSKETAKNMSTIIDCTSGCNSASTEIDPLKNANTTGFYWLKGDLDLNSNTTIGSDDQPIVLFVESTANFSLGNGNANFHGTVFKFGDWNDNNSNGAINGTLIVEGSMSESGTLDIFYSDNDGSTNRSALDALSNIGNYIQVAGTWLDF